MSNLQALSENRALTAEGSSQHDLLKNIPYEDVITIGDGTIVEESAVDSAEAPTVNGNAPSPGDPIQGVITSVGDDLIYHRIWVEPLLIDVGFITEESENNVYIWNADYGNTSSITGLTSLLPSGTSFSLVPGDLPVLMGVDEERIYVVTVDQSGPPIQDTHYYVTVNGVEYDIYVTGTRVVPINQEPDWSTLPKYRYKFQTVLSQSPTYQEQRRALTSRALREAMLYFVIQNNLLNRFVNEIAFGHDKVFGVPIYSEASVLSTAANNGGTTLIVTPQTDNYWNLNNLATHVIVVDYDQDVSEIKEINTVNSSNIVLARGLINDYPIGTMVFPCFFGTLKAVKTGSPSDNTQSISVEFKEFIIGSQS